MLTKAERTKQFIIETAAPIYNQKGISGANIDDVLDATKLTKGCLYGHFENKEDLSLQVIDYMIENNSKKLLSMISKEKTAKRKIFNYFDFYKNPIETHIKGGCPLINMAVESDDNFPRVKEKIAEVFRQGQNMFVEILKQGIQNGEFSNELLPEIYAFKAVAAIEGAVVMCRIMNTAKPMQGLIKSLKIELENYSV